MDFDKLGLKMGLEVHQQLNSEKKLFCNCKNELIDEEYDVIVKRNLRPTQSELGTMDRAALHEGKRKLNFRYELYNEKSCLIESDDEPPRDLNLEALKISITIAELLNMRVVDEFHTMRKQILDGSNTGGYQRTGLIATDGYLETPYGKVLIETLGLEEDAARRIETNDEFTEFRLDRLGIPLAEITTDPSMHHPDQVREVAYMIGQVLRSTNVKRGLGTIRQDLNISIAKGARVEIKGVQNLDLMSTIVENEVQRQLALIDIKEELEKRNAEVLEEIHDLNDVFKNTSSKILSSAESIKGVVLKGFAGLIGKEVQPNRRFGTEIASYAKKRGVSGIFHTDELPAYGIEGSEVNELKKYLNVSENDAIIIVAHKEDVAISALEEVKRRANLAFEGVVEETRKSTEDGNTEYMRPLPTANRMYLETDIPLFKITDEIVNPIKNNLPELPDVKKERIIKEYNLSEDLATQLVRRSVCDDFEEIISKLNVDSTTIASVLAYDIQEIKREGHNIDYLNCDKYIEIFTLLENDKISKDAISDLITKVCENPDESVEKIADDNNLTLLGESEVRSIINEIVQSKEEMVKDRGMGAMGPLMGMSMKKLKGKADGSIVNKILQEEINNLL
ncbi:Glu-tRNA(Gln) amidotransferase subunit GatE [Methanobrevibacter sp. OttesenSCG-928-I08]|nr:Glu-tRNA(Gln) amidotransferase subunit GatE [Methanobrevibacter sp. OttesenSCG-928-I08]